MISRKLQSLWHRRKAVSPVIATILLIALTVAAVAIVYFVVIPLFQRNPELVPLAYEFEDSNGTDYANKLTIDVNNLGTATATLTTATVTRNGETVDWYFFDDEVIIAAGGEGEIILLAQNGTQELGFGHAVVVTIPYSGGRIVIEARMTAEFSDFVILYNEDFEGTVNTSVWTHTLISTHGGGTHSLDDWVIAESSGNHYWHCTNNDFQWIVLEDDNRIFDDVNVTYDLMTRDDDANGIIFRYDDTGAYPKFYIVWFTYNYPDPDVNPPHNGAEDRIFWDTPADKINRGYITVHYVEGFDNDGIDAYRFTKLAEEEWSRSNNEWYTWKLTAEGSAMQLDIYGDEGHEKTVNFSDSNIQEGYVGLISIANQNSYYDNIYVWKTSN
jgi:flagellin-like protein